MQSLPDAVTTPRLTLRRWQVADAPALHKAVTASVEHLRPWMEWIKFEPLTVSAREELIRSWEAAWTDGGDAVYGVFHRDEAIGGCGFHRRLGPGGLEIGYWIHAGHLRQGYASELSLRLTEVALAMPGIELVEIHHDKANGPSGGVPRALGYTMVGEIESEIKAPAETGTTCVWRLERPTRAD